VLVLQKLLPFVQAVSGAESKLAIRKLTILPGGAAGGDDWAKKAIATNEQLRAATGIDLGAVARRFAAPAPPAPGTSKPT
jgi:hypothetical protein